MHFCRWCLCDVPYKVQIDSIAARIVCSIREWKRVSVANERVADEAERNCASHLLPRKRPTGGRGLPLYILFSPLGLWWSDRQYKGHFICCSGRVFLCQHFVELRQVRCHGSRLLALLPITFQFVAVTFIAFPCSKTVSFFKILFSSIFLRRVM